ncbi:hypothetical protein [Lacticaseibacillus saniviri]
MNTDVKILAEKFNALWEHHFEFKVRYQIRVVDNKVDGSYDFYFEQSRQGRRQRSIPLHSIKRHELEYLETTLKQFRQVTQLTYVFANFEGQRWHSDGRLIQRKPASADPFA